MHDPRQNRLLAALSKADYLRILPRLELIDLPLGKVVYESGRPITNVYFPINSIISMLYVLESGSSAEISIVGNEGIVGIALFLGGDSMPNRAIVQSAGHAYRLDGQSIKQEFDRSSAFKTLLLRYTLTLFSQMAQTTVCNRHHTVDQQLCRWLLLSHDRIPGNELIMTQELIADMLGVRREGVTEAAGKLHEAGLIKYSRGHITIMDRPGLEVRACECYMAVQKEFKRLFPDVIAG